MVRLKAAISDTKQSAKQLLNHLAPYIYTLCVISGSLLTPPKLAQPQASINTARVGAASTPANFTGKAIS